MSTGIDTYAAAFDDTLYEPYINVGSVTVPAYAPIRIVPFVADAGFTLYEGVRPPQRVWEAKQPDDVYSPYYAVNSGRSVPISTEAPSPAEAIGEYSIEFYTPILLNTGGLSLSLGQSFGVVPNTFSFDTTRHGFVYLGDPQIEDLPDVQLCMQVPQQFTLGKVISYDNAPNGERKVEAYSLGGAALGQYGQMRAMTPWGHQFARSGGHLEISASDFGDECFFMWTYSYWRKPSSGAPPYKSLLQLCNWIGGSCG